MGGFRTLLRFMAAPVFFALAALLYVNPQADHGAMMAGHMAMMGMDGGGTVKLFGWDPGPQISVVIASMWFMYLLMGVFHLSVWLEVMGGRRKPE